MARSALCVVVAALCVGIASASLYGVTYDPFSKSKTTQCLDKKEMQKQLTVIGKNANNLRLYSLTTCEENTKAIMDFAIATRGKVVLGLLLTGSNKKIEKEFDMLEELVKEYGDTVISGIAVGNELIYLEGKKAAEVIAYIKRAKAIVKKAKVDIPVSTAESWPFWEYDKQAKKVVKEVDFICMNMSPYWEGIANTANPAAMVHAKAEVLEVLRKKDVTICGTGWPTMGEVCCEGRPRTLDGSQSSPDTNTLNRFLADLDREAQDKDRRYFVTEAIDGDWKRVWAPCNDCVGLSTDKFDGCDNKKNPECEVDYHFGLFEYDGSVKKGVVIP